MKTDRIEHLYAFALRLFPARFRETYGLAMMQAFRDARADASISRADLARLILRDLAFSLLKEHITMIRESLGRPALLFNAVVLAGISTILAFALYAIPQQVLRQGANDPQIALAGDAVARLEAGIAPADVTPANVVVDMGHSLTPFVIVYDDQGHPLASQAQLDGQTPVPPSGVFDYVRTHREERVSWQPILGTTRGVRIAAVVDRVSGNRPGFVLAGRNMREVEAREELISHMAGLAWIGMLGLILVGTLAFAWYTRPKTA
jgi:hypothetical protein